MIASWVRRLFGRGAGRARAVPGPDHAVADAAAATPGAARVSSVGARGPVPLRWRPLLDRSGHVAARELLRHGESPLPSAAALAALAQAHAQAPGAGEDGTQAMPALPVIAAWDGLAGPGAPVPEVPAAAAWAGLWLALPTCPPGAATAAHDAWRRAGVKLGVLDQAPKDCGPVDFVHLRGGVGGLDALRVAVQRWQEARPGLPIVLSRLESLDDVERMLAAGVRLAGGRLDRGGREPSPRPLQPAAHRVCVLLNDLALDRDTARIAASIRADVNLAWRLLRVVNSPALGLARQIESIDQAVALLGRDELRRWLGVLLLAAGEGRPAAAAVQTSALVRGRLLELLADDGPPRPDGLTPSALFTLGLLVPLPLLLQVPPATAFEPLGLAEPLKRALLERTGPLAPQLDLLEALDGDDESAFERAARPWGGGARVAARAREAWAWADAAVAAAR